MEQEKFIQEIRKQCSYLHSHEDFIEKLLKPLNEFIPHDAYGATGFDVETVSAKGIYYGIPAKYLSDIVKINLEDIRHVKKSFELCQIYGYNTSTTESFGLDFSDDKEYKILYEPHGFQHGMQTYFLSETGVFLGFIGLIKKSSPGYTDKEMELWEQTAPYVMHAFRRYRWLLNMELFCITSLEDVAFSALITDMEGKIVWSNALAKENIPELNNSCKLPDELKTCFYRTKDFSLNEYNPFIFREVEIPTSYGNTVCFAFDKSASAHLPIDGEGILFIVDSDHLSFELKHSLSDREKEVLKLIVTGKLDKEIAHVLNISVKTVNNHAINIFKKLKVSNRSEAAVKALRLRIF